MSVADLPKPLGAAVRAYNARLERFGDEVASWLMGELAVISRRYPGRTVTLYSGNGAVSLEVTRRRPRTHGDFNERAAFRLWDSTGRIRWARWIPVPEFFAELEAAERETGLRYIAPVGAFSFRDGERIEQKS